MLDAETVQKILDQTDWNLYNQRVAWGIARPSCSFHDGNIVCPCWRDWIAEGARYYASEQEHLRAVLEALPSEPRAEIESLVKACRETPDLRRVSVSLPR